MSALPLTIVHRSSVVACNDAPQINRDDVRTGGWHYRRNVSAATLRRRRTRRLRDRLPGSARTAPGKPAKLSRRHAYQFMEATRKMALIGKAAGQSDLGQRQLR